jgi:hypothetical protein
LLLLVKEGQSKAQDKINARLAELAGKPQLGPECAKYSRFVAQCLTDELLLHSAVILIVSYDENGE